MYYSQRRERVIMRIQGGINPVRFDAQDPETFSHNMVCGKISTKSSKMVYSWQEFALFVTKMAFCTRSVYH